MIDNKTARAIEPYFRSMKSGLSRAQVVQALMSKDGANRLGFGENTGAFAVAIADAKSYRKKASDPRHNEMLPFFEQRWKDKISKMPDSPRLEKSTFVEKIGGELTGFVVIA